MDRQLTQKPAVKWTKSKIFLAVLLLLYGYKLSEIYLADSPRPDISRAGIGGSANSYGYAPLPVDFDEPVVQVYAARTRGTKKAVAVHSWIATKRRAASHYEISQVIGWRLRRGGTAVFTENGIPDRDWYGNNPELLLDIRGADAEALIDKIDTAIAAYPWAGEYTAWPGPNSNTFVAWVGLQVPGLGLDLPSTAIGKDWRPIEKAVGLSASGTGVQASLFGLLGASVGYEEGLELNVLGLSFELDLFDLAVELPGVGRIGSRQVERSE